MFNKMWKNKEKDALLTKEDVLSHPIPNHVAIIMDGNGRWAKKRALPRVAGHYEGMQVVRKITRFANELGVRVLSLYAFSTENWKRPKSEVDYLMKLPEQFLTTFLPELVAENVKVQVIGRTDELPDHTRQAVRRAIHETSGNTGLILNFALNYGSRAEITAAVQQIAKDVQRGALAPGDITESLISSYLMTGGLDDPDLLIRTSGEIRLSNFMLWQLAYTEFWFTDVLWPDFTEQHFLQAIAAYQQRDRRFGGVSAR
ncbi:MULTISPECIES: isoprenyl transferase [Geobacillus]|jgi:undecaprenyl diphosphate synthase|uniref:Isoprenyl transferase n=2 Tax=Geobacillus thermodenitrificans TaxID=33940 RepID=A4IMC7_GEOTN|nr:MULTISPECIES: isoprenyl transferase [Geobacillus]ABO66481.1 Undecaprenyl diphosphate synthase [Geobacillus thermodenitrificans NG80-2]ARP42240.1 Isoprenyl transferase [Geobacillus thermodenitrificans]ATO36419.1 isoprenyl transferase [Geobacillus thermodenitrificans]KQB93877.1 Isoprenyl transferase [Geobacillus sp. PA-3]MEC5188611.1 undecaprenyl diphosphate synthase [Geobacillus thermodenitrificans]